MYSFWLVTQLEVFKASHGLVACFMKHMSLSLWHWTCRRKPDYLPTSNSSLLLQIVFYYRTCWSVFCLTVYKIIIFFLNCTINPCHKNCVPVLQQSLTLTGKHFLYLKRCALNLMVHYIQVNTVVLTMLYFCWFSLNIWHFCCFQSSGTLEMSTVKIHRSHYSFLYLLSPLR